MKVPPVLNRDGETVIGPVPAGRAQDLPPGAARPNLPSPGLPAHPVGAPALTGREALVHFERIIEESLAREDQRAMALLAVHDQQLYQLTHASFRDYLQQRWGLSRARGYQLLHLPRVKTSCRQNGQSSPANERQARQITTAGAARPEETDADAYAWRLRQVTRFLAVSLAKSRPGEQRRFLAHVRHALDRLEQDLNLQLPAPGPAAGLIPALQTAPVSRPDPTPRPVDPTASGEPGPKPDPQASAGQAPERPLPRGFTGSVLGLTMSEARRLGYVH